MPHALLHLAACTAHLNVLLQLVGDVLPGQSQLLLKPSLVLLDDTLYNLRFVIKIQLILVDDDERGVGESCGG